MMANQMMQHKEGEKVATQAIPTGYKQTEFGVIPEDWDVLPLASICREIGDGIHTTPTYSLSGDYFFINGNNIKNGNVVYDENVRRVDEAEYLKHSKTLTSKTIFLSINGTIGNLARYKAERLVLGKSVAYLTIKDSGSEIFSYYALQTEKTKKFFEDGLTGSTIKNLGLSTIRNTMIPVPSYEEQTAIANVLSDSDALIDSLEQLIAKKQAIKSATMQQLLTGRTRLPAFAQRPDGTPKGYKSSELGQIPEDWEVVSLGDASQFINGRAYALYEWESSGVPVIRLQNLTGRGDEYYYSNLQLPERQYCDFGDLLFMWSATFGPVIWKGSKAIYHYHIWKIECKGGNNKTFLFYLLGDMTERLKNNSSSGGTMLHVTKEKMESTKTISPSVEEQTAIANVLSDMDSELNALEQKLAKARDVKQGMMQQLLTGRIRLPLVQETTLQEPTPHGL